jgi:hypothetical protein
MKLLKNISSCFVYYFIEVIGQILYLPFRIAFWIINIIIPKMGSLIETTIWSSLEKVDRFTISNLGFHIIHYPKSVRDMCYNCRRLKPTVFVDKTIEIVDDIVDPILPLLIGGLEQMVGGLGKIMNAFNI